MFLKHGLHLAYCTNVHPGEVWGQTLDALERYTLAVKRQLGSAGPFAIGLRLGDAAARELVDRSTLTAFRRWLERHDCYVFTINGFPFGQFHGTRVKERVYWPDWTDPRRLEYTNRLFDLLSELVPPTLDGSVSTLPGSFKEFVHTPEQADAIRRNLWQCVQHVSKTSSQTGRQLHLGLEPEPFGLFENSLETVRFFEQLRAEHPGDERLERHLGVNYDTCHFAVEFEEPEEVIAHFKQAGIRLSKIHISNALKLEANPGALTHLADFAEDTYLHQVLVRQADGSLARFKDLDVALAASPAGEWRVHFHIPLHSRPTAEFQTTADHVLGLFKLLARQPGLCSHLEMETYTWGVLPEALKAREVSEQIVDEYRWTLARLSAHGLAEPLS